MPKPFAKGSIGSKIEVAFQIGGIGKSHWDFAGLHGQKFFMAIEVVIFRQEFGANQFLLENIDEIQEINGLAVADIVNFIGRVISGRPIDNAADPLDDVIDVGKIALAVAVIENLNIFAAQKFISEFEISHIGTTCRAVDGKKSKTGRGNVVKFAVAVG